MTAATITPFDSDSESRYEAFRAMRSEAGIHDLEGGQRFFVSRRAVEGQVL